MGRLMVQWLAAVFSFPDLAGALVIAGKTAVIYIFLLAGPGQLDYQSFTAEEGGLEPADALH
jgi:hypothetical protein